MSGSKRRSKYRKHVVQEFDGEIGPLKAEQELVRVTGLRGSNLFEVETTSGTEDLCLLPTRFRKLLWVKRGSYLIVTRADTVAQLTGGGEGKVTLVVDRILFKEHISELKARGDWPTEWEDKIESPRVAVAAVAADGAEGSEGSERESDDGMAGVFVNRNRLPCVESSDSEDSSDEEESDG